MDESRQPDAPAAPTGDEAAPPEHVCDSPSPRNPSGPSEDATADIEERQRESDRDAGRPQEDAPPY
jgi:hypothetical protein